MFIQNSMTKEPLTVQPDLLVTEAVALLRNQDFRHLPVVDEQNILQGMLTDRDLRSACPSSVLPEKERARVLKQVQGAKVEAIMSREYLTLTPASTLDDALLLFKTRSIGALPVVNERRQVVGIFSLNDLMASYRRLFGLGDKGSVLMAIVDPGDPAAPSRLVQVLEDHNVFFSRLIRAEPQGAEPAMLYVRINTMNIRSVHRIVEEAGFVVHIPEVNSQCR